MPIRSGAMQRPSVCRCGNTLRQRYDEVGLPCNSTLPEGKVRTSLSAGGRWIRTSGSARARTTPGSASCALPGQSNAPAARARLERDQAAPGFGEAGEHCRRTRYREDG
jgi:hypothetical protein